MCQCYHWAFKDAIKLTLPQIIMLNHGAFVNQKRGEERYEKTKKKEDKKKKAEEDDPIVYGNKRLSELTSDEYMAYFAGGPSPFSQG